MENPQASVEKCQASLDDDARREARHRFDRGLAVGDRIVLRGAPREAGVRSGNLRLLRSPVPSSYSLSARGRPTQDGRLTGGRRGERARLERDLHDGVQSELVALIVKLAVAREEPETPPALAATLAELEARAQAALESVRDIARGIYPAVLADFGLREALRAQARRADIDLTLVGTAPRSTEEAEEGVYFACSEALQNIAKHAGGGTRSKLSLDHHEGSLVVEIADDGRGFELAETPEGGGLQNIRDRVQDLGGAWRLASEPGGGTILTLLLPWPVEGDRTE